MKITHTHIFVCVLYVIREGSREPNPSSSYINQLKHESRLKFKKEHELTITQARGS
ncbi:hypothetical protein HanPI659440_Chr10g0401591 [Helianthus annuus]|nr:hypothetical protein HanPI659440_Chr10g0401591 [Helianthus annuus]